METYDKVMDETLNRVVSEKIKAVEIPRATKLVGGDKYNGYCLPILCYAPPCPCMGRPIIWVQEKQIIAQKPSGSKSAEGDDILDLDIIKGARIIMEMPISLDVKTIKAIQNNKKRDCNPKTVQNKVSISDALGGPKALLKGSFLAGFAIGTWADDQLDGGLSDQGADYIEGIVDFWDDLWD